ncbi:MAG: cobalamin B12-binding domain-containing protein [Alphaproteobacteria bacterium]|nr:cobalamin B12-binding domain-containing protein [Alphaproteobacteria bacterium]
MNTQAHTFQTALAVGQAETGARALSLSEVEQLARLSLQTGADLHNFIAQWQDRGIDLPDIYLQGITEATRVLGCWWLSDEIDFASVTVGSSRLLRLLYDLSPQFLADATPPLGATVLMLAEPESQHTMGLFMLSEFFRRAGWYTLVEQPRLDADFLRLISGHWIDVLALSVSTERQLLALKILVRQARQVSPNPHLVVIAGGPLALSQPKLLADLGVDWVGHDAPSTVERASQGFIPHGSAF